MSKCISEYGPRAAVLLAGMFLCLACCTIYEFPDCPETVEVRLRLEYETEMTIWNHTFEDGAMTDEGTGPAEESLIKDGYIRHLIKARPLSGNMKPAEFVYIRSTEDGYGTEATIDIKPGEYEVQVWSDFISDIGKAYFYNASDFAEIRLRGTYTGSTDYRDAFRGRCVIDTESRDIPVIMMERPLAKYEFMEADKGLSDHKVIIHYEGFLPAAYNMYTYRPVDAEAGIFFESSPKRLNSNEMSLGFDYVFADDDISEVTVRIGVYDKDGRRLAMTGTIQIPLRRNHHTIIRGSYLQRQSSGGIVINPIFDGNYNIIYGLNSNSNEK